MHSHISDERPLELFGLLWERTKHFTFSEGHDEPKNASEEELRSFRLRQLINFVQAKGRWEFRQMPDSFRAVHSEADGAQEAILILLKETVKYQPRQGYSYDGYMRFLVPRRLIDFKRKYFRMNPPVGKDLEKVVTSMRRSLKRTPTSKEIAEHTGLSEEDVRRLLEDGAGPRVWGKQSSDPDDKASEEERVRDGAPSAEAQLMHGQFLHAFLDCIEQLSAHNRSVIMRRHFDGETFEEISASLGEGRETIRSRCRRAVEALHNCISNQHDEIPDFWEALDFSELSTLAKKELRHG